MQKECNKNLASADTTSSLHEQSCFITSSPSFPSLLLQHRPPLSAFAPKFMHLAKSMYQWSSLHSRLLPLRSKHQPHLLSDDHRAMPFSLVLDDHPTALPMDRVFRPLTACPQSTRARPSLPWTST